jgi:hypothetical protein
MDYDFFNGDADGILSLHQYRLNRPAESIKYTGIKRDIELLRHVSDVKDSVFNVFDISMETNHAHALHALENNNKLNWFDHHVANDDVMSHDNVTSRIDTNPNCCTSLLVDEHNEGEHRAWTIAGAYGDNLHELADNLNIDYSETQMNDLRLLGETLNYNGYGNVMSDLVYNPLDVYNDVSLYKDPFMYIVFSDVFKKIYHQMKSDKQELSDSVVLLDEHFGMIVKLPDTPASVRYSGIYSNKLTTAQPERAFAILTTNGTGYKVSIRAPKNNPIGASSLALQFPTGGGREKAAGINMLDKGELVHFYTAFKQTFSQHAQ